ncbi:hypothetical protein BJY52DRAFT_1229085 [Lactarius psammicola]|nr:hypothetical protein BJY52DRAFT_1229085 [Lactarius psammicola]
MYLKYIMSANEPRKRGEGLTVIALFDHHPHKADYTESHIISKPSSRALAVGLHSNTRSMLLALKVRLTNFSHKVIRAHWEDLMRQPAFGAKMVFKWLSPSTASYPPSPTLHRVPLLPHPLFPPFPYRIRGTDEYVGIRLASEYLAVSVDTCNQRVLRPTLRSTLSPLPTANSIDIVGPGHIHEGAGTTVDFRTLEGSLIEVYLHTMQPTEALAPPPSASAPRHLLQRQRLLPSQSRREVSFSGCIPYSVWLVTGRVMVIRR